jgi:hypothetical protein
MTNATEMVELALRKGVSTPCVLWRFIKRAALAQCGPECDEG